MSAAHLKSVTDGNKRQHPVVLARDYFNERKHEIAAALPKHLNADRMIRLATTALTRDPKLQECSVMSLYQALILSSQLGLEIGVMGQAYIVPYKRTAQFIPGWQGLVDLVSRAGRATVQTGAVFEGDDFDWALGDSPFVKHKPCGESDPALMTHAYAIGRVRGAEHPVIECWPTRRIKAHRDKVNKVGGAHYSFAHFEMYARKVVLLQVLKYMPKSIEMARAVEAEVVAETGETLMGDYTVMHETPGGEQAITRDEIEQQIADATNGDQIDAAVSLVTQLPEDERPGVIEKADARRAELTH